MSELVTHVGITCLKAFNNLQSSARNVCHFWRDATFLTLGLLLRVADGYCVDIRLSSQACRLGLLAIQM
jgi:hypothetical protein